MISLTDEQMSAVLAASNLVPPDSRSAFLEHVAHELAAVPEVGDGALHRIVAEAQSRFFDAPALDREMPRLGRGKYR